MILNGLRSLEIIHGWEGFFIERSGVLVGWTLYTNCSSIISWSLRFEKERRCKIVSGILFTIDDEIYLSFIPFHKFGCFQYPD
jgi:hypothetical protein